MKKYIRSYVVLPLMLLLLTAIVCFRFFDFITHINSGLITLRGDGLKNYYGYLYYAKWGQGDIMMNGMAYPWGEHIVYTDGQPILAFALNFLQRHGIEVAQYGAGILHVLLLASFLLASVFIYLIVKRFRYPDWYTFIITVIISLLSPQLYRIYGHFALASVFFIPALWYFLIRAEESGKPWIWYGGIFLTILLHGFLHPYYLPIGAFFLLSYALVATLQHRKNLRSIKYKLMYLTLVAMLPMIIFKSWTTLTDDLTDRPKYPYGILNYHSSFDGVFLPPSGSGHATVNYFITTSPKWEGWAFVGWAGTLVLIFSVIRIYKWAKAKKYNRIFLPALPIGLRTMIWAAVMILLVSMAFPFRLGMTWILEIAPSLKQFRSLGRFAWIFYYVFTVYTAYYLYAVFRLLSRRHKQFGVVFISMILLVWSSDAWISFAEATTPLRMQRENVFTKNFRYEEELSKHGLSPSSFQAILPLPFFIAGTEKIDTYKTEFGYHSFVISYQTGLPISAEVSARYSFERGQKIKQLLSADEIEKTILKEYKNNKPVLVVHSLEHPLCEEEVRLLKKCKRVGHIEGADLYQLDLAQLRTHDAVVNQYQAVKDSLITLNGYSYTAMPGSLYKKSFEEMPFDKALFGKGVLVSREEDQVILKDYTLPVLKDSVTYELSLWMYLDRDITEINGFNLFRYNADGSFIEKISMRQEDSYDLYKGWERIAFVFTSTHKNEKINLQISAEGITIDDLVLRPIDADVYYEVTDTAFVKNNYPIQK